MAWAAGIRAGAANNAMAAQLRLTMYGSECNPNFESDTRKDTREGGIQ